MKYNKRFIQRAIEYIKTNGPATAEELHDALRFTKKGRPEVHPRTKPQVQQILCRSKLLKSHWTKVARADNKAYPRYTTYKVRQYSVAGEE